MMSPSIVILTGAGISQESGLKTFRDEGGLWEGNRVEDVATSEAFEKKPSLVHRFYNQRRKQLKEIFPNKAHLAISNFQKKLGSECYLVTQNVDDLHERAGSTQVAHMHGELKKARCLKTAKIFQWEKDLNTKTPHPEFANEKSWQGLLRPHICWFGEVPFYLDEIFEKLKSAKIFVAIGTSGNVYPAAGFVQVAAKSSLKVLINKDSPENASLFDTHFFGSATTKVPEALLWIENQMLIRKKRGG